MVFAQPEIGTVGLSEAAARELYAKIDIYKTALTGRDERSLMKLVVDGLSDQVLGCHIIGPGAAEMAQLLGIAVKARATKADFDATMALHPTAAEELVTMRLKWSG
jgi:glutathione reductase (NADPH)